MKMERFYYSSAILECSSLIVGEQFAHASEIVE